MSIWFGPAGSSESFTAMGYKKMLQMPDYLERFDLNAFEYQCGRGVKVSDAAAAQLGEAARQKQVRLSLHAPYFISLSSTEEDKREGSIRYILESARAVSAMGGDRIVVHSGSCAKVSREEALALAMDTMRRALRALDEENLGHVRVCPETMGKVGQLGTLDEVLTLCTLDERMIPCIDFGHLYARTFGGLKEFSDFELIFDSIENKLGLSRLREYHAHFSRIRYTVPGGEKVHLTFADTEYGPEFGPVAELTLRKGCHPTIICESAGTQAEDAAAMRDQYRALAAARGQEP